MNAEHAERALLLAPHGRDAAVATGLLGEAGIDAHACASFDDLVVELDGGAGFVVVTEEICAAADLRSL